MTPAEIAAKDQAASSVEAAIRGTVNQYRLLCAEKGDEEGYRQFFGAVYSEALIVGPANMANLVASAVRHIAQMEDAAKLPEVTP